MLVFFFFKQKTAYEMRISDWSSDVCSSDLQPLDALELAIDLLRVAGQADRFDQRAALQRLAGALHVQILDQRHLVAVGQHIAHRVAHLDRARRRALGGQLARRHPLRSEEHTSELQSLMRISYAVFCLKK